MTYYEKKFLQLCSEYTHLSISVNKNIKELLIENLCFYFNSLFWKDKNVGTEDSEDEGESSEFEGNRETRSSNEHQENPAEGTAVI